jgi:putative transposase
MFFCINCRKNILNNDAVNFLKNICSESGERYPFEFDAIGCDGDEVHLFVGAEPKYSPSRVMQIIKSITARKIFKICTKLKTVLVGELWSDRCYIGTVGYGTTSDIITNMFRIRGIRKKSKHICKRKYII